MPKTKPQLTIPKMELFHTPQSADELATWIESLPGPERALAMTVMGMTWNYLAEVVEEAK